MRVPILKQADYLIASIQSALTDADLVQLRDDLAAMAGQYRARGVIVDVTALDVMDSFAVRTLRYLPFVHGAATSAAGEKIESDNTGFMSVHNAAGRLISSNLVAGRINNRNVSGYSVPDAE